MRGQGSRRCRMRLVLLTASLVAATLGSSLVVLSAPTIATVREQQALWQSQGIMTYQFVYQKLCFCPPPNSAVRLTVLDEQLVAAHDVVTGAPVGRSRWSDFATVDELFNILLAAEAGGADSMQVSYDPVRGYPTRIAIDYIEEAIDDEVTYLVTALEPQPVIPRLRLPAVFIAR